jgi:hypothetical protein
LIAAETQDFRGKPAGWELNRPVTLTFWHDEKQQEVIDGHLQEFGSSVVGIGRILSRIHVKKMYRQVSVS